MQPLRRAARLPEIVVARMGADERVEVGVLPARLGSVGGMLVDDAVLVPPVAGEELPRDAAVVAGGAIEVVQAVVRGKAGKRGRLDDAHPPLRHAEIRLT